MMEPRLRHVDRVSRTTPLGLRFWDALAGELVGDGLAISAHRDGDRGRAVGAVANTSSAWSIHGLIGLGEFERGAGDAAFWATPRPQKNFIVEVEDAQRRFVPFSFVVPLPPAAPGFFEFASALAPLGALPLFSSPTRLVPSGTAVVRAQLRDAATSAPAAWAVLEALVDGAVVATTVADANGAAALLFAYPEVPALGVAPSLSPSGPVESPLDAQGWSVALRARWVRGRAVDAPPDLAATLAQPAATLWASTALDAPLGDVALTWGREAIVRSVDQTRSPPAPGAFALLTPV